MRAVKKSNCLWGRSPKEMVAERIKSEIAVDFMLLRVILTSLWTMPNFLARRFAFLIK